MVTDILREELQFDNVIITDAMNMKVITKFYDADQAAVMAIEAGNDMILMPDNFEQAFEGVLEAVKDGTLSESQIDEAAGRVLSVKIKRGILPESSKLFRHNEGK
ncbi:MAG: glycoside hydrolase family 3 N-terminal domain-containing protein [Anaerobutyricum soehngenii]